MHCASVCSRLSSAAATLTDLRQAGTCTYVQHNHFDWANDDDGDLDGERSLFGNKWLVVSGVSPSHSLLSHSRPVLQWQAAHFGFCFFGCLFFCTHHSPFSLSPWSTCWLLVLAAVAAAFSASPSITDRANDFLQGQSYSQTHTLFASQGSVVAGSKVPVVSFCFCYCWCLCCCC